jgi:hypothetical protein
VIDAGTTISGISSCSRPGWKPTLHEKLFAILAQHVLCPGATAAIDEFLENKPEQMLALDNGGGFFIKGTAVANGALNT